MTEAKQVSQASLLAALSAEDREKLLGSLSPEEMEQLNYDWDFWARPNQLPPEGDWNTWVVLAGRGFGKTRMGSEWIRKLAHGRRWHLACQSLKVEELAASSVPARSYIVDAGK